MANIYKRIRTRREDLGISQEELANRLGYKSRSSINKIEKGENDIPQSKIQAFAKALRTTPEYLMGWEPSSPILILRRMLGDSQLEFAGKVGVTQSALNSYEQRWRTPPAHLLERISNTFKVPIDFLRGSDLYQDDDWHFYSTALQNEREQAGLSLEDLSAETGIPTDVLEDYEEDTAPISEFLLKKLCDVYGKSIYQFLLDNDLYDDVIPEIFDGDVDRYEAFKRARDEDAMQENLRTPYMESYMYQYVPYGVSAGALEEVEAINELPYVSVPDLMLGRYARNPNIILMPVNGESMNNVIEDGAIIAVLKNSDSSSVTDGDIVVIQSCGEYSVKRFFNDKAHEEYVFRPDSNDPSFRDIVFSYDDCDDLRLIGKVVMYNVTL